MENYWKRSLYYFRFGPVFFWKYLKGYRFYIIWEKKLLRIDGYLDKHRHCICTDVETRWRRLAIEHTNDSKDSTKWIVLANQKLVFYKKSNEKQLLQQTIEKGWEF
ncbi:TPA_asm: hypothetical protein GZK45_15155 [Listeria innocua]|uniref:hypothetical protein n=1 Tax=Listeria monocytogenes TaxID=1639 RepID=UPI0004D8412D|nr:hypothetical protein [Listeria monocytogenes]HAC3177476.1 hypothetical protein [Listeria innocua]EAD4736094.1 hypothetical protein [Listeria monocytogenes]EAE3927065.1 hypothetical protein [Listeria monocytogenes]EAF2383518.1 hypothetical protein [Listeria monocytogenes]EAF2410769.1 hypothetical protein [Listeria monocytogenes]